MTEPAVRRPPLWIRWQLWVGVGVVLVAVLVAVSLMRSSDNAKTSDLRSWLASAHKYDTNYDDLGTATYKDGNVTVVASRVWADRSYGAYFLCAWVEPWLRGGPGGGSDDSQIIVMMGGQEVLRSRGHTEDCLAASAKSPTG